MTTMNAWYLNILDMQLELWLWRAYMVCGDDIFHIPAFSDDLEWQVLLTDGVYRIVPAYDSARRYKEERTVGSNLGDIAELYQEGFFREDIFIGLWTRLQRDRKYCPQFGGIISEMQAQWHDFVSPPKNANDYKIIFDNLRRILEGKIVKGRGIIAACNERLAPIDEDERYLKDDYRRIIRQESICDACSMLLQVLKRAERNEVDLGIEEDFQVTVLDGEPV